MESATEVGASTQDGVQAAGNQVGQTLGATSTLAATTALRTRDVPPLIALVTAELAVLAIYTAFDTWCTPRCTSTYTELARAALLQLHAAAAAIT